MGLSYSHNAETSPDDSLSANRLQRMSIRNYSEIIPDIRYITRATSMQSSLTINSQQKKILANEKIQQRSFQFILIDLSTHLTLLAKEMLNTLKSISRFNELDCIFEYASIDECIHKLIEKTTYLFVSNKITVEQEILQKYSIKKIFILEDNNKNVDYKQRFNRDIDLIFELVDQLYRCYKEEAENYYLSRDFNRAEKINELADEIHQKLKIVYNSKLKHNEIIIKPVKIIWFIKNSHKTNKINHLQNLIQKYVSSFSVFDDESKCKQYLHTNQFITTIFLIINEQLIDLKDISQIKNIYHYENIHMTYDDLCFELISDLADWYYKSGSTYSHNNDGIQAKQMFVKSHELYEILSTLK